MASKVLTLLTLLLLIAVGAMAEGMVVTPQQLAERTSPGQTFNLVMKTGHSASGKVVSVGQTELTLKVKKSQDRTVLAKGLQGIPYSRIASISVVIRKGNKRTKLPLILCATVGTLAFVAAGATEELKSKYLPRAPALTAGLGIGGYYLGKKLDQQIVENGGAKLDHRAANRSCFWAE